MCVYADKLAFSSSVNEIKLGVLSIAVLEQMCSGGLLPVSVEELAEEDRNLFLSFCQPLLGRTNQLEVLL